MVVDHFVERGRKMNEEFSTIHILSKYCPPRLRVGPLGEIVAGWDEDFLIIIFEE
jgi:hypothetical protein